jgi:hypothetical protein
MSDFNCRAPCAYPNIKAADDLSPHYSQENEPLGFQGIIISHGQGGKNRDPTRDQKGDTES